MEYCKNYTTVLHGTKTSQDDITYLYRTRCKQWSCDYCAEVNRRVWMRRIVLEAAPDASGTWYFWTLTLDGDDHGRGVGHSLKVWRGAWDKLTKRLRRLAKPQRLRYLRVFETHQDGTLHVHMLADYAPADLVASYRWNKKRGANVEVHTSKALSAILSELGLGWVHDIKPLLKHRDMTTELSVAAYLGKYLTKDMQSSVRKDLRDAGMGIRMIQTSRNWAKMETETSDIDWALGGTVSSSLFMLMRDKGIFYYDLNRREFLDEWHAQAGYWPNHRFEIIMDMADKGEG